MARESSGCRADFSERLMTGNCSFFEEVPVSASGDQKMVENISILTFVPGFIQLQLKKTADHAHIQGFAKASGTGKKVYLPAVVQELFNHQCFIDIIQIFINDLANIFISYGHCFLHADPSLKK